MSDLSGRKVELPHGAIAWQPCMIASDSIGKGTNVGALSHIGRNVQIGNNCRIQGSVYIADGCIVGSDVFIGPNATLTNDRFPPSGGNWNPVVVEDKVVIGANAVVVAGVTLHSKCIIAAGSVVTKDVPTGEVWAGNPAKFLMTSDEYESKRDANE